MAERYDGAESSQGAVEWRLVRCPEHRIYYHRIMGCEACREKGERKGQEEGK